MSKSAYKPGFLSILGGVFLPFAMQYGFLLLIVPNQHRIPVPLVYASFAVSTGLGALLLINGRRGAQTWFVYAYVPVMLALVFAFSMVLSLSMGSDSP